MAFIRFACHALAVLTLATCASGCRIYSRQGPPQAKPAGFPLSGPVFDSYEFRDSGHPKVKVAIEEELAASGMIDPALDSGLTLRLRARVDPQSISIAIDILNVLTVGLVPKIREHKVTLKGSFIRHGEELLTEEVTDMAGSWELWLPLLFWPPSWTFLNDGVGSPEFVEIYHELTQQLCVALAASAKDVPDETWLPPTQGGTTTNVPQRDLTPCSICGEPRGNENPCPHCGMD